MSSLVDRMARQSYRAEIQRIAEDAKERGDMANFREALKSFLEDLPE